MSIELSETYDCLRESARAADGEMALLARTGSRAYGTDRPESDHDFRGVYRASMARFCSMGGVKDSIDLKEPHDAVAYELGHFFRLAAKGNPTALETLWSDEDYILSPLGLELRGMRGDFLSKRVVKTYGGYALSQMSKAERGVGGSRGQEHHKRMKFKLHTLRLLDAGIHILVAGEVQVRHPMPHMLRALADAPIENVRAMVEEKFERMQAAAKASKLPDEPNIALLNRKLYDLRRMYS